MEEIWKPVPGYKGYYEVSNLGRVRRVARVVIEARYGEHLLNPWLSQYGYPEVTLIKEGKAHHFRVHRLVAEAFLPNPDGLPFVNHKDEDKTNAFVWVNEDGTVDPERSNLEWCTPEYNRTYGSQKPFWYGKRISQIYEGKVVKTWSSLKEIVSSYKCSEKSIIKCLKKEQKQAYGYVWEFYLPPSRREKNNAF